MWKLRLASRRERGVARGALRDEGAETESIASKYGERSAETTGRRASDAPELPVATPLR